MLTPCHIRVNRYHDTRRLSGSLFRAPNSSSRECKKLARRLATKSLKLLCSSQNQIPERVAVTSQSFAPKLLILHNYLLLEFLIERGVSGHPLSLQTSGRKDSDHADDEFSNRTRSLNAPASPSGTTSTVGCRGSLAGIAAPRRKPFAASRARPPRAPLFRTDRADLSRGRFLASRFRSWGAVVNRPASPRTPISAARPAWPLCR